MRPVPIWAETGKLTAQIVMSKVEGATKLTRTFEYTLDAVSR